jgi:hypothetical protein
MAGRGGDRQALLATIGRRPPSRLVGGLPVQNRERINLDKIARREGGDSQDDVGRLVIAEQRHASFFDDRQMSIALIIDDVDRNPCHLTGTSTGGCEGAAEIGEHPACLNDEIARADKLPTDVLRFLARNEYQLGSRCDNDLGIARPKAGQRVRLAQNRAIARQSSGLELPKDSEPVCHLPMARDGDSQACE